MSTPLTSQPSPGAKLCVVCGVDCANKQRTKDAQGRYICADCMAKAKETKQVLDNPPAPKPKPAVSKDQVYAGLEEDNSFLLDIGGQALATEQGKECPKCGVMRTSRDVLCLSCGYNFKTGKKLHVKIEKAKVPKGENGTKPPGSGKLSPTATAFIAGLAIVGIGVALHYQAPERVMLFQVLVMLVGLISTIYIIVKAFGVDVVTGFLTLFVPFYAIYYAFAKAYDEGPKVATVLYYMCSLSLVVYSILTAVDGEK